MKKKILTTREQAKALSPEQRASIAAYMRDMRAIPIIALTPRELRGKLRHYLTKAIRDAYAPLDVWEKEPASPPVTKIPVRFLRSCVECGRRFDLRNETDQKEWHYGHDCES